MSKLCLRETGAKKENLSTYHTYKIHGSSKVIYLNRTTILECYLIKCGSKKRFQKYACLNEVGLYAQNMITILSLIVDTIEGTYMII